MHIARIPNRIEQVGEVGGRQADHDDAAKAALKPADAAAQADRAGSGGVARRRANVQQLRIGESHGFLEAIVLPEVFVRHAGVAARHHLPVRTDDQDGADADQRIVDHFERMIHPPQVIALRLPGRQFVDDAVDHALAQLQLRR